MSILFEPVQIGGMPVKNRFVHSATHEAMAAADGRVNESILKRYKTLAQGGIGLILPGHLYVHPLGKAHPGQCGIHDDAMLDGLSRLTEAVHRHDAKIALQLAHAGRQALKSIIGQAPLAPSKGRDPASLEKSRRMTNDQIKETIDAFISAAKRAVQAGADAVELHAAHGYLLNQFLSPFFNRRKDAWGGSDENRFWMVREIILGIKAELPGAVPLMVKLNTNDYTPKKGIDPDLAATYARWMVKCGVDAVETSCGTAYSLHTLRGDIPTEEMISRLSGWMKPIGRIKLNAMAKKTWFAPAYNLEAAQIIKPKIKDTVLILVGGLRRLSEMERVIENGDADMIAMSRPFIREPFLVKKFSEGKSTKSACLSCNKCFAAMFNGIPVQCYRNGIPGHGRRRSRRKILCGSAKKYGLLVLFGFHVVSKQGFNTKKRREQHCFLSMISVPAVISVASHAGQNRRRPLLYRI